MDDLTACEKLKALPDVLDGRRTGPFEINRSTSGTGVPTLTVYNPVNKGDEMDEQLTFTPMELIRFCRDVLKLAEKHIPDTTDEKRSM